jgi:hypothetical protein
MVSHWYVIPFSQWNRVQSMEPYGAGEGDANETREEI